jgi:hypothetical protein
MRIRFYEIGKSKKGILRRALKMWYMFADYNNMEKNENQLCSLVKPQRPSELHKETGSSRWSSCLVFFRKKIN